MSTFVPSGTSNTHKQPTLKQGLGLAHVLVSSSVTPNHVSLVSYNIEGLSSLHDADTRLYLSAFDFCLLVETFASPIPLHLFPERDAIIITPGVRLTEAVTARLSGGLALLVKKQWSSFVERVHVEYDNMIVSKVSKDLLGTEKPVVLLGVYLPPSSVTITKLILKMELL